MATVTVCGTATATVQPDSVVLSLGLTHLAPAAAAALDEVAARSARLAAMLADHGLAPSDWVTDGVNVAEESDWRKEQRVLVGFRASSGVSATVRALDRVGEMIGAAVTDCGANVRDLSWRVDADNPARRALLGEAAVDARVRAEAYASALGVTIGAVESVSELPPVVASPVGPAPMAMRAMAKGGEAADISVSGGRIELTAAVYVQFALLA